MRTKMLTRRAMLRNINGLSEGDRACCGPYGNVRCVQAARRSPDGVRKFAVDGSWKIRNGRWTMSGLRKAITGEGKRA